MIDHTGIGVADMNLSAQFYDAICATLGMVRSIEMNEKGQLQGIGYGKSYPIFWIDIFHPHSQRYHTAFRAETVEAVDAFFAAGLKNGGRSHGEPGYRSGQSTPIYYAAFLLDPDGNNIECVFRG